MDDTRLDVGWVAGCIVAGVLLLICLGLIVGGVWYWHRRVRPLGDRATLEYEGLGWSIIGTVAGVVVVGCFIWSAWPPFDMAYHRWERVTGVVDAIEPRLLQQTQIYAVTFDGSPQTYRCDDTRCATVQPGDGLSLWCKREWQQAAEPGYVCNFDRRTPMPDVTLVPDATLGPSAPPSRGP